MVRLIAAHSVFRQEARRLAPHVALHDALASIHRVTAALEPGVTPTMKGLDATLDQARQALIRVEPQLDQTLARAQALLDSDGC